MDPMGSSGRAQGTLRDLTIFQGPMGLSRGGDCDIQAHEDRAACVGKE